jgi:hypothetical protein
MPRLRMRVCKVAEGHFAASLLLRRKVSNILLEAPKGPKSLMSQDQGGRRRFFLRGVLTLSSRLILIRPFVCSGSITTLRPSHFADYPLWLRLENGGAVLKRTSQELMDNPDVKSAYFGL